VSAAKVRWPFVPHTERPTSYRENPWTPTRPVHANDPKSRSWGVAFDVVQARSGSCMIEPERPYLTYGKGTSLRVHDSCLGPSLTSPAADEAGPLRAKLI
jgi:hypothetical protein